MSYPSDSIKLASLELRNRLAMAPVKTAYGTKEGQVTDQLVAYFRRRAKGGVGLIISEPLYVERSGREHPKQIGVDSDDKLEGLTRLAEAIHEGGAKAFAHLNHAGRAANPKASGGPPEAPSNVPCPRTGLEPVPLTEERIAAIVRAFGEAARRAKRARFDGVEVQLGLGYLVAQFFSAATNLRTDSYGGDAEGRLRFAREVLGAVREAVGDAFPVGVRISGTEKAPGGLEIDDAMELARRAESWGASLIHVATGSSCDSPPWYFQHMSLPPGVNEILAAQIRDAVGVPVMAAGRLGEPRRIREVLGEGLVDMVALGRPLLADPDLPRKLFEGRDDEVLLCGECLQGCLANVGSGKGIGCNINPGVGHEGEQLSPAREPKRVVVVGGGPAGIQAALTAQSRGHRVTLFEKDRLGGQFALGFLAPGKQRMERAFSSFVAQVERSGVELRMEEEATVEELKALSPDAVIVASGSRPIIPDIPGLEAAATPEDIFTGTCEVGGRVLVLGGGMIGLEVAELLAGRGREVVVVKGRKDLGSDMDPVNRALLLKRLGGLPVQVRVETKLLRLDEGRAIIEDREGESSLGRFETVVVAQGNRSFDPLSETLREMGIAVHLAGDAVAPARLFDAVNSGRAAALSV